LKTVLRVDKRQLSLNAPGFNGREMTTVRTTFIEDAFGSFVEDETFAIRFVPPTELTIGHHRRTAHAVRLVRAAVAKIPNCEIEIADKTLTVRTSDISKLAISLPMTLPII
jgi:hypothetical protein